MITCNLAGGLGNQLFSIFTTIAYAMKYSKSFIFFNIYNLKNIYENRHTYWKTFLVELKPFLKDENECNNFKKISEVGFHYNEIKDAGMNDMMLVGYFQSYKYFDKYKKSICKLIKINEKKEIMKNRVKNIDFKNTATISMHFRFGDYKKFPELFHLLSEKYYTNSLTIISKELKSMNINTDMNKNIVVIYFCDKDASKDSKNIIKVLKYKFPHITFQNVSDSFADWEQMLLMSLCNHNIMANSTFSWWGAYLNTNDDNIVCYPKIWFDARSLFDTRDMCLTNWIPVEDE